MPTTNYYARLNARISAARCAEIITQRRTVAKLVANWYLTDTSDEATKAIRAACNRFYNARHAGRYCTTGEMPIGATTPVTLSYDIPAGRRRLSFRMTYRPE